MRVSYLFGGVFLSVSEKVKWTDGRFLLSAAAAWLLSAVLLLTISTILANSANFGEQALGYLSSANSFLCAAVAGHFAAKKSKAGRLSVALITGTALCILLLTVGFLAKGEEMDPSSVLSVVSFTYAGVLTGVFLIPKSGKTNGKYRYYRRN